MIHSLHRAAPCPAAGRPARVRALRALALVPAVALALAGVAGCGGHSSNGSAAAVTSALGAVPIPTAPSVESTESGSAGHPAVLAIGGPVTVTVGGAHLLATALGPEQVVSAPPSGPSVTALPRITRAVITLQVSAQSGAATVHAGQLSSRDETGRLIPLAPQGAASARVSPGHPVTLRVAGTFSSGAAQVTWAPGATPLAIWTFNIELD